MNRSKKLTLLGALCALAYAAAAAGRVPLILFLKYDPKDIVLALSGLTLGPLAAASAAVAVALVEMFTLSDTGILGFLMNVLSSCSFACTAAFVYQKKRSTPGAAAGLLCGWACMVLLMLLWNYLIAPIYMGLPREELAKLLLPVFLPFNLIKGGINAAITLLVHKPVISALKRSHLLP